MWLESQRTEGREKDERTALLSGVVRRASERDDPIEVTSYNVDELPDLANPPQTPIEGVDRLILFAEESTHRPDARIGLQQTDYPLLQLRGESELQYYFGLAAKMELIDLAS